MITLKNTYILKRSRFIHIRMNRYKPMFPWFADKQNDCKSCFHYGYYKTISSDGVIEPQSQTKQSLMQPCCYQFIYFCLCIYTSGLVIFFWTHDQIMLNFGKHIRSCLLIHNIRILHFHRGWFVWWLLIFFLCHILITTFWYWEHHKDINFFFALLFCVRK